MTKFLIPLVCVLTAIPASAQPDSAPDQVASDEARAVIERAAAAQREIRTDFRKTDRAMEGWGIGSHDYRSPSLALHPESTLDRDDWLEAADYLLESLEPVIASLLKLSRSDVPDLELSPSDPFMLPAGQLSGQTRSLFRLLDNDARRLYGKRRSRAAAERVAAIIWLSNFLSTGEDLICSMTSDVDAAVRLAHLMLDEWPAPGPGKSSTAALLGALRQLDTSDPAGFRRALVATAERNVEWARSVEDVVAFYQSLIDGGHYSMSANADSISISHIRSQAGESLSREVVIREAEIGLIYARRLDACWESDNLPDDELAGMTLAYESDDLIELRTSPLFFIKMWDTRHKLTDNTPEFRRLIRRLEAIEAGRP